MTTDRSIRREQVTLFGGLFLMSLYLNTMPPLLVSFQETFGISMSRSAAIPLFHSMGTISANVIALFLLSRLGTAWMSRMALASAAAGLTLVSLSRSLWQVEFGILLTALAFGLSITAFSTIMAHYPAQHQRFSLLHGCFGAGGLIAPLIVRYALRLNWDYHYVYGLNLALLLAYILACHPFSRVRDVRETVQPNGPSAPPLHPVVLILLGLMSLYSVSEMSVVIWSGNFFQRTQGMPQKTSALLLSAFWFLYTVSRLTGDRWIHRLTLPRAARIATTACLAALVLFLFAPGHGSIAGFLLAAAAMGTIFPTLHLLLNRTVPAASRASLNALLFLSVSVAGFFGIPLVGVVADRHLMLGMGLILVPFLLLSLALPTLTRRLRSES